MRIAFFSATLLASGLALAATPIDGWYSSVFGGYTYLPNNIKKIYYGNFFDRVSYDGGYHGGARFGFQSNPMRYEAEFTYLKADVHSFERNKFFGWQRFKERRAGGQANAALGMGNIYYDFPEIVPCIVPYLGVGIGYGWIDANLKSYRYYRRPGIRLFKGSDSTFAYQGTAGLTFNFSESYAINLAYRYVGTTHLDHLGKVFQGNLGSIGVVYRFNEYYYK
ncbi:outer membrane protein [Legionella fairfieldensis]|uniref:outer membrane protein n=1 Tax=Legionella fairfieldensis TaxID=45064 RepID=UPI00048CEA5C|nr:outer membrane beta-barrel protein [Legionella fairfieldensis]